MDVENIIIGRVHTRNKYNTRRLCVRRRLSPANAPKLLYNFQRTQCFFLLQLNTRVIEYTLFYRQKNMNLYYANIRQQYTS